jgi:hypothetical protein
MSQMTVNEWEAYCGEVEIVRVKTIQQVSWNEREEDNLDCDEVQ